MSPFKASLNTITADEIRQASSFWLCGEPQKIIAFRMRWTETLMGQVIKLCREFDEPGEEHFPYRNARPEHTQPSDHMHEAALVAAKKPVTLSRPAWKAALSTSDCKPSTVKARRPGDYLPRRRATIDPTLALPGAS